MWSHRCSVKRHAIFPPRMFFKSSKSLSLHCHGHRDTYSSFVSVHTRKHFFKIAFPRDRNEVRQLWNSLRQGGPAPELLEESEMLKHRYVANSSRTKKLTQTLLSWRPCLPLQTGSRDERLAEYIYRSVLTNLERASHGGSSCTPRGELNRHRQELSR